MFKKFAIVTPLAVLALNSSLAFAVEPISQTINVRTFIPTATFNVAPQNPDFGKDLEIRLVNSNDSSAGFQPVSAVHNLKHTDAKGAINAFIEGGQAAATLYNGTSGIPMTVSMGSVELTDKSEEIVNETDSVAGVQRTMTIRTSTPTAAQTGDFAGVFTVVYEPVMKP
ncbi:adhesin [Pseudomonas purpurea]|uniref:adhesin n=1 Tax=Pseudomonas purpurea TaxID=3136737 RepID=UPI0032670882